MTKASLMHLLNALQSAEAEFEQLMIDKEWFVTDVVDQLESSLQIVEDELLKL